MSADESGRLNERCKLLTELLALKLRELRINPQFCPHTPTARQTEFLRATSVREVLYGGAAGGGKSDALLMAALQYVDQAGYSAILFRRTYKDLALSGALMDRAASWLHGSPAKWNQNDKQWRFPSGAALSFGYLDAPSDRYRYQGAEFQFIGFDEVTQIPECDYTYLFSRLRRTSGCDVPLRIRAATNPGGPGHEWVRRRFRPDEPGASVSGRRFVAAKLEDNPHLDQTAYVESLGALDSTLKRQLLYGDWSVNEDALLSWDVIDACTDAACTWAPRSRDAGDQRQDLFLGVDIGRSRDLSVVWTWEKLGDVCWCREIHVMAGASFREQKDAIKTRLTRDVVRCSIDKGGIGMQLAEELEREHRGVVEGVQLTQPTQGRLAEQFRVGFAERRVRIPDDQELRSDLRLVQKVGVRAGVPIVQTGRDESGHADRFWAGALGYDAASWIKPIVFTRPASRPVRR